MGKKGKVAFIFLIVLILVSLAAAVGSILLFQKERQEKTSIQEQLNIITKKESETQTKLVSTKKIVSSLEASLQEFKVKAEKLTAQIEEGKAKEQTSLKAAYSEIDQLMAQLEKEKKERKDLDKMLSQSYDEMGKMSSQLKDLEQKKVALETKLKDLEQQGKKVELGKIVVSPEVPAGVAPVVAPVLKPQSNAGTPGLEGKVLVINKDYNFLVTNLGKKDGIAVGDTFSIFHGADYVGDVKIEKIHDSMSAAGFTVAGIKEKVNEGDKIVQKK